MASQPGYECTLSKEPLQQPSGTEVEDSEARPSARDPAWLPMRGLETCCLERPQGP